MNKLVTRAYNRTQKYFGVNLDYIIRGGFWLGLDQIASIVIGLGVSIAFANLLPPETYGTYRYVLSFLAVLTISTVPNMNVSITTYVARGFEGLLKKALITRIRWGFIGATTSIAIAGFYIWKDDTTLGFSFLIMAVFLPFMDSFNIYTAFLKGRKLFRVNSQFTIFVRIVSAAALIGAVLMTDNILIILIAFFAPYVIVRPLVLFITIRKFPPNTKKDPTMLSYGKHLSVIQLFGVAINYLDNVIIFNFLGAVPLAIYSIALAPIQKIRQGFSAIHQLALPKFSEQPPEHTKKLLMRKLMKLFSIVAAGVALYIILAPTIFRLVFPKYTEAIFFSQLLAMILLSLPFGLLYTFLQSQKMKRELYQYNIIIRVVQLIATVTLIPLYGLAGAVLGRLVFQGVGTVVLIMLFRRA